MTREEYSQRKQQLMEVNKILVKKDQQRIRGYVERKGLEMTETETGLWYHIEKEGDGEECKTDDRVTLKYKISLLDGTECYNSDADGLKTFHIGRGGVESGLEEGILLLRKGSLATFIMPPHLAHGLPGDGERIPARAILIYEVEVLAVDKSGQK